MASPISQSPRVGYSVLTGRGAMLYQLREIQARRSRRLWRDAAAAEQHREFYNECNAVLDMPAEFHLDTIKTVIQDCSLANGIWVPDGKPVRPRDIWDVAPLTVEEELDDIAGVGQTEAAHALSSGIPESRKKHLAVSGAGRYGVFAGRHWRELVYPTIAGFIAQHATRDGIGNSKPTANFRCDFNNRPAQAYALTPHG
jgi:polyhydroxyalkanoate depolymerase